MANEGDLGNKAAEEFLQQAIDNAKTVSGNERLTGFCRWCKEPTAGAFCSAPCRDDYTKHERMKR